MFSLPLIPHIPHGLSASASVLDFKHSLALMSAPVNVVNTLWSRTIFRHFIFQLNGKHQ